ncbi:MAG: hypothetical protein NC087_05340 [Anaeroplasma bactoclasticum]|nr:hypothetical protein [Anaeroplasma bactoclasticum]
MKFLKKSKKVFLSIFCIAIMLCTGFLAFNFGNDKNSVYAATTSTTNQSVTYADGNLFGQFIDGYVYQYTDSTKYSNYRNGTETSDVSQVVVSTSTDHGSQTNPFVISTADDWTSFVKYCGTTGGGTDKYYVLANDIDFDNKGVTPVASFNGTFYGNGHSLKNITIDTNNWVYWDGSSYISYTSTNGIALFCKSTGATITDLVLDNYNYVCPDLSGTPYGVQTAGLVGTQASGTSYFLNCHVSGNISGTLTRPAAFGGVVSYITGGTINFYRCSSNLDVEASISSTSGTYAIGGIYSTISASSATINLYDCVAKYEANITSSLAYYCGTLAAYNSGKGTFQNFVGYGRLVLSQAVTGYGTQLTIGDSSSNLTATNMFADGKAGTGSNQLYLYTSGGTGFNTTAKLASTYMVYDDAGRTSTSSQLRASAGGIKCVDNAELIENAKEKLTNENIWNNNNIGNYGIDDNPVRNYAFNTQIINTTYSKTYDGTKFKLEDIYSKIETNYDDDDECIDAGSYLVAVTLKDDNLVFNNMPAETRTAVVTVNIKKATISFGKLPVDEYGNLVGIKDNETVNDFLYKIKKGTIYTHDSDPLYGHTNPEFALEYQKVGGSWSDTLPNTAGTWYVRTYIKNDNPNYTIITEEETVFERPKTRIAVPFFYYSGLDASAISSTVTTITYSGNIQELILTNNFDNGTLNGVLPTQNRSDGLLYSSDDKYGVSGVGSYSLQVRLADTVNTQWADGYTEDIREITLVVEKAPLKVQIDQEDIQSWVKGDKDKIKVYVNGIIGTDVVNVDATYGKVDGDQINHVVENNKYIDPTNPSQMIIEIDTINIPVDEEWFLTFDLPVASSSDINRNYELDFNLGEWHFMLTNAIISQSDFSIGWVYNNISNIGTGTFNSLTSGTVPYNGQNYTVGLNETLLHKGIKVEYIGDYSKINSDNSQEYTVTALLSPNSGYTFDDSITKTSYSFTWKITPIEYDVSDLIWNSDFTYTGSQQTMTILNLPSWIVDNDLFTYKTNKQTNSGSYTATCVLDRTEHANYIFVDSTNSADIDVTGGDKATLTHAWKINEIVITVSNSKASWTIKRIKNPYDETIELRVPNAINDYAEMLIVTYYSDSALQNVVNPTEIVLNKEDGTITGTSTYYAKVELNMDYPNIANYVLRNTSNTSLDYAVLEFTIGGDETVLRLTLPTSIVYNGETRETDIAQQITSSDSEFDGFVSAGKVGYVVKYYAVDNNSDYDLATPLVSGDVKYVGRYVAVVELSDAISDSGENYDELYVLYTHIFQFEITQLKLTIDWPSIEAGVLYKTDRNSKPSCGISGEYDDFYIYEVYEETSSTPLPIETELGFNKKYVAALSVNPKHIVKGVENVVLVDSLGNAATPAATEFKFITGPNTDTAAVLNTPEIVGYSTIEYDGQGHKIVIRIEDRTPTDGATTRTDAIYIEEDALFNYVEIYLKIDEFTNRKITNINDTNLTQTNAGVYTYIIKPIDGTASWYWRDSSELELVFTITKKPIIVPSSITEYDWNDGNAINIWTDNTDWLQWVDIVGDYTASAPSDYSVTFTLKDTANTCWDDKTLSEEDKVNPLTVNWKINTGKIVATWDYSSGYPVLILANEDQKDLFTLTYYNVDDIEVSKNDLVDGVTYSYKIELKPENVGNYEFVIDEQILTDAELTDKFTYEKPRTAVLIEATWDNSKGYPVLNLTDGSQSDFISVKYYETINGEKAEVSPSDLVDGKTYSYEIIVSDDDNYIFTVKIGDKFLTDEEDFVGDFTYEAQKSFFDKALDFVKTNWLWFAIGAGILLLLIILIIVIKSVKKRKKKKAEEAKNQPISQQPTDMNGQQYPQQPMPQGQPYPQQPYPPVQPQGYGQYYGQPQQAPYGPIPTGYGVDLQRELQQLRDEIKDLKRDTLASEEERSQSKNLGKVEDLLIKFILNNFDKSKLPEWMTFASQDIIDHPVDDLMKYFYLTAQLVSKDASKKAGSSQGAQTVLVDDIQSQERSLEQQIKETERKLNEYRQLKEKLKYDKLLKDIRKTGEENADLRKYQEDQRKENLDRMRKKDDNN